MGLTAFNRARRLAAAVQAVAKAETSHGTTAPVVEPATAPTTRVAKPKPKPSKE